MGTTHKLGNGVELREHERYADYYYGFAGELDAGDGLRLLPKPGRGVPAHLVTALVVAKVERLPEAGLVAVTVMDRAGWVNETLASAGITDGARGGVQTLETLVLDVQDEVLVRF